MKSLDFSVKNIPIPSKSAYKKRLMEKVESLVRRMRQKAKMYSEEKMTQDRPVSKNYGFRSDYAPPKNEHLNAFENDLYDMVRNIEFTQIKSAFLSRLKNEVNSIKKSSNIIISADKTSNMYEMGKESYEKLLKENVTKVYKK